MAVSRMSTKRRAVSPTGADLDYSPQPTARSRTEYFQGLAAANRAHYSTPASAGLPAAPLDSVGQVRQINADMAAGVTLPPTAMQPGPRASLRQRLMDRNLAAINGRMPAGMDGARRAAANILESSRVPMGASLDGAAQLQGRLTAGGGRYPTGDAGMPIAGPQTPASLPLEIRQRILRGETGAIPDAAGAAGMEESVGAYRPGTTLPSGTRVEQGGSPTGIALIGQADPSRYASQIQRRIAMNIRNRGGTLTGDESLADLQGVSAGQRSQTLGQRVASRDAYFGGRPRPIGQRVASATPESGPIAPSSLADRINQPATPSQAALTSTLGLEEGFDASTLGDVISDRLSGPGALTEKDLADLRALALQQQARDPDGFGRHYVTDVLLSGDKDILKRIQGERERRRTDPAFRPQPSGWMGGMPMM